MFNFKSAYFYILAVKINLKKKIKKTYFTTKHYNQSLFSKTPDQLYFHPNPFLLSSFTQHKNFTFKVANINKKIFWEGDNSKVEEINLHNFLWLNLVDRKVEGKEIKKIIAHWIYKNSNYKKTIWENPIISKRIISWILNADIILSDSDAHFKQTFFQIIIKQINHLKKNIEFENDYSKKIETISSIILSGLVFKEYTENYHQSIKELEKLVNFFFDKEGFPINKNPNDLIKFSKFLILIKECIKDAQEYVPDFLDEIIEKNLNCIKSITTPNAQIPLFNGATEQNFEKYFKYVEELGYKLNKPKIKIGNLQIIKNKKHSLYFDVGSPPKKSFSKNYQSGPLSFEYFLGEEKIITNCGFGHKISKKAMLISRLTSAQSSLTINDNSVVKFERNKSINSAFGNSIINDFDLFDNEYINNKDEIKSSAKHNAYEKKFGFVVKRELKIDKVNDFFSGSDEFIQKKNVLGDNKFNICFHLYPGLSAIKTIGGNSVLIQLKKNKSLIFECYNQQIDVVKSIFLGGNKILNNLCINVSGNIIDNHKKVNWVFKKNI